jgi:hypothetical protein
MIKFFRQIRKRMLKENKMSKYLLYAIGEIVLVVIGILIALQINTWNEERKARNLAFNFIELLIQDLNSDAENLSQLVAGSNATVSSKNLILDYLDGDTIELDSLSTHFLGAVFHGIESFVPNKGAIEEIKNAGGLSLINDQKVSNQILDLYNTYDRFEKNTGQNYVENRNATRQLVFERAKGNFFNRDLSTNEEILGELMLDSEIRNRLINNWSITYNSKLREVLEANLQSIKVCKEYLQPYIQGK